MSKSIYEEVTSNVLQAMQDSIGQVESSWIHPGCRPFNAVSGKPYHGTNVILLWQVMDRCCFSSNDWATYKQWQQFGGQVRNDERSTRIVFFKPMMKTEIDKETGEEVEYHWPMARYAYVFNRNQVDGVEQVESNTPAASVEHLDQFVQQTQARVEIGGAKACYIQSQDLIRMPDRKLFTGTTSSDSTTSWYAVLLHELTHWTSHTSRLDRKLSKRFGDEAYAMEELIAELGSAFLCADLSISSVIRKDHVDYLVNWIEVLESDNRAFFTAAAAAEKAVEYCHQLQTAQQAA